MRRSDWSMKSYKRKNTNKIQPTCLKIVDKIIKDKKISEEFNNFFGTTEKKLLKQKQNAINTSQTI